MSLWWVRKRQLDDDQLKLIEDLPLRSSALVTGPPGCGKTNILLRRARFIRPQGMTRILLLTFTRSLTEFIKTGCFDEAGNEVFPVSCVSTYEQWIRALYEEHGEQIQSQDGMSLPQYKAAIAKGASKFPARGMLPKYDCLFIDEAQDLLRQEVELLAAWSDVLFVVGDNRQKIFHQHDGLVHIREIVDPLSEHSLKFHYRISPEICSAADKILQSESGKSLSATSHYSGPKPGHVRLNGPLDRSAQIDRCKEQLVAQLRVYSDFIRSGDLLGIVVAARGDRDELLQALEADPRLRGQAMIVRARQNDEEGDYSSEFQQDKPIIIVTVAGCKGLEFRATHWPFCDENNYYFHSEHYYTVLTRSKTGIDLYFGSSLPRQLASAYVPVAEEW